MKEVYHGELVISIFNKCYIRQLFKFMWMPNLPIQEDTTYLQVVGLSPRAERLLFGKPAMCACWVACTVADKSGICQIHDRQTCQTYLNYEPISFEVVLCPVIIIPM